MSNLREQLEFPLDYTFKIIGENTDTFTENTLNIFREKENFDHSINISKNGTFKSISVTVFIENYDELYDFYVKIKKLEGLKYHL
jgi:putative lipoic acid-binding regulatory protein